MDNVWKQRSVYSKTLQFHFNVSPALVYNFSDLSAGVHLCVHVCVLYKLTAKIDIFLLLLEFLLKNLLNQILSHQHTIMWTKIFPFISEVSESLWSLD